MRTVPACDRGSRTWMARRLSFSLGLGSSAVVCLALTGCGLVRGSRVQPALPDAQRVYGEPSTYHPLARGAFVQANQARILYPQFLLQSTNDAQANNAPPVEQVGAAAVETQ